MKRVALIATFITTLLISLPAGAAIQVGDSVQQAPSSASTTQKVGQLITEVIGGDITSSSSSVNGVGILSGAVSIFNNVNDWLRDKAGINFLAILKGIGHFFLITIEFVIRLLKTIL